MATELGKAYVQIIPSAQGISGAISSELGGSAVQSAGKSAGTNIAGAIKGAIVAAGIGTALKSALDAGGNLQQSFGGLDTLYEDAAGAAKAYAAEAAAAGISANSYAEQAVSFGASLKQAFEGDTVKAVEAANTAILDMADNSAKMGTDITSIQNAYQGFAKQNYTMLDNLKLGYGGTKQEMERLLADAQELSGVEYDLSNLGDVYAAIHVIQENLGLTGVAADEASTTFTGSLNAMKAAGENLLANLTLGEDIGPSLTALGASVQAFLLNNLFPMIGNVLQSLPEMLSGLSSILIGTLNMVSNNADEIVQIGIDFVTSLVGAIVEAAPYLLEAAVSLVAALGQALIETDWVQVGTDLINSLKDSMSLASAEIFGSDTSIIDGFLQSITNALPTVLEKGVEILTGLVNGIMQSLPELITTAGQLITTFTGFIMENLPTILEAGVQLLLNLVHGIIDNLPEIITAVLSVITTFVTTIGEHLPEILQSGIEILAELIAGLIGAIPDLIAAIPQIISAIFDTFAEVDWLEIGINILEGIAEGIANGLEIIVSAAMDAAKAAFDAACDFLGINSPATKGIFMGEMLDEGFAVGIDANTDSVKDAMTDMNDSVLATLETPATGRVTFENNASNDDKMDTLLGILVEYLPEIASNKGVSVNDLYNGLNRQLGVAIS